MAEAASEPKTNIIHCVYRATVDDIDEYGGVILFEERFDISQVDWIRVWYDDVTEEIFDPTVDDILFLPLSPGDWRIDIKVNNLTNCHGMFAYTGLLSADFSEVDISMITNCDSMFYHCDKLIKSPFDVLPIKELTAGCCAFMFQECSNLTKAPELPASILVDSCYIGMFLDCVSLNYIKMLATDISASGCLSNWVNGVSPTGTFVANKDATWDTTPGALGDSGVPAGWTVITEDEESGGLISFYIYNHYLNTNELYQAEEGMTWSEWIASSYNTDGYILDLIVDKHRIVSSDKMWYIADRGATVWEDETIISNKEYILESY